MTSTPDRYSGDPDSLLIAHSCARHRRYADLSRPEVGCRRTWMQADRGMIIKPGKNIGRVLLIT